MKIFMATEAIDMSLTIKMVNDKGETIYLRGRRSDDHIPVYGCTLNDGEANRLKKWINGIADA